MARDFKLSNFTFTTAATPTGTVLGITATSPAGDLANTGATIGLNAASTFTSVGVNSDAKQVMGFRNSRIQPIDATASAAALQAQLASIAAGNEISAITNDPALPGNTSYGEMFMSFNLSWNLNATAANNLLENGGYFVVEGAYDNGFGAIDTSSFAPISGAVPLVLPSANLAAVALTANVFTCVAAHILKPGDLVVMYVTTGLTGATVKQQYQVFSVPAPNQFTLTVTGGTTVSTITGTPVAGTPVYRCLGGAVGGHRAACQITPNRRPYMRLAFRYATAATAAAATLSVSRVGLTLGRDNATTY
jgi:hypothetical protein